MASMHRGLCEREYGVPATVAGARQWAIVSAGPRVCRYRTAGLYVAACRRLDPTVRSLDRRLIAAGWNRVPPREWVRGERRDGGEPRRLAGFVAWWGATQGRPERVGSSRNSLPEIAFAIWAAPSVRHAARSVPAEHWRVLVTYQDDGTCRPSPRGLRHARPRCGRHNTAPPAVCERVLHNALRRSGVVAWHDRSDQ